MSQEDKINAALRSLASLEERMGSAQLQSDKSKAALDDIRRSLKPSTTENLTPVAETTTNIALTAMGSIDKFKSNDPVQIAQGVVDIMAAASGFLAATGPQGALAAVVAGGVLSLVSGILGMFADSTPTESPEDMLKRVVTEALAIQTDNELQSLAQGEMRQMEVCITTLVKLSTFPGKLSEQEKQLIVDREWLVDGVKFINRLWFYINKDLSSKDRDTSRRTAKLVLLYTKLSYLRHFEYSLHGGLLASVGAYAVAAASDELLIDHRQTDEKRLGSVIQGMPGQHNHRVYGQLVVLGDEVNLVHSYHKSVGGRGFSGRLLRFYNTKQKAYLYSAKHDYDNDRAETWTITDTHLSDHETSVAASYMMFRVRHEHFEIFSCHQGGYIYAADFAPKDKDRRRVFAWRRGNRISQGEWHCTLNSNKYFMRNTKQNEYMYCADFGAQDNGHNRKCPTYTWRRGNPVNQGYFELKLLHQFS